MSVRSYSATAPRICRSNWSGGSWLLGRSVHEFDLAAGTGKLVEQQHLVDGVARQAIGCGEHHQLTACGSDRIPQGIQPGSAQWRATPAVVTNDQLLLDLPGMVGTPGP